ncbi:MAG: MiaB/RimO family radical SAM methylthiotransferase [Candidatus Omnitrophica bacterium]|nr:MiaB/RimO family radical SAM methylthiotransferase [Candidatus Omnitrophota bacterium]MCM8802197.1 MiaB/RimO family radical SAM methylthiotransferase [Candidatus Omnitrophota bacterium]
MAKIITFGCKVNQYESQLIKENIEKDENFKSNDIVILNSCCVTEKAEKEVEKKIRELLNQRKKIYLTGCIAEKNGKFKEIGNIKIVEKSFFFKYKDKIEYFNRHTRAFVKIEDGCENFCTYCIIPFIRGRVKSRSEKEIIEEIKQLVENGYKEIVLTGVNLGCYGKDTGESLISLIEKIQEIEEIKRIRLSSIEVYYINEPFINSLKNIKKFCPHFHMPLQSGSDKILSLMGRRYSFNEYYEKIEKIKEKIEKVTFTTDIMVGFPGEKDDDFEKSCIAIDKIKFLKVHIFPYSERKITSAVSLPDKVDEKTKKERLKKILKISEISRKKVMEEFIGKRLDVLFEKKIDHFWKGYSENYIPVIVNSERNLKNEIVSVIPQKIYKGFLLSKILNQKRSKV